MTDDGLKKMGLGTLTLDKTSTYTGTTNILAGVLQPSIQTAISGTATVNGGATLINVGPNGTYDASLVQSLNAKQTLSGTGHVTGFLTHTNLSSVITGGGVGTAGTLTFDNAWIFRAEHSVPIWIKRPLPTTKSWLANPAALVLLAPRVRRWSTWSSPEVHCPPRPPSTAS